MFMRIMFYQNVRTKRPECLQEMLKISHHLYGTEPTANGVNLQILVSPLRMRMSIYGYCFLERRVRLFYKTNHEQMNPQILNLKQVGVQAKNVITAYNSCYCAFTFIGRSNSSEQRTKDESYVLTDPRASWLVLHNTTAPRCLFPSVCKRAALHGLSVRRKICYYFVKEYRKRLTGTDRTV